MKLKEISGSIDAFCKFWQENGKILTAAFGSLETQNIAELAGIIKGFMKK